MGTNDEHFKCHWTRRDNYNTYSISKHDCRNSKSHHPLGNAARRHEVTRQHKERDGHERVVLTGLKQLDGHGGQRILREQENR